MRDGLGRRVVKRAARALHGFDLWVTRLVLRARGEPRYRLTGPCDGCGKCCEAPAVPVGRVAWRLPAARRLLAWWHRAVNGFELVEQDPRLKLLVFRCTHYDAATKRCDSYGSRPLMCRDYPANLLYEALPPLFEECSHRVVHKNAEAFRAALEKTDLAPDARAALEKKLNLRE